MIDKARKTAIIVVILLVAIVSAFNLHIISGGWFEDLFGSSEVTTLTTSDKVISYDYVDKVNAIDFELATEKEVLSKGINSAESYLRIPSDKERPAKIILMTDDKLKGVWLKEYSIKTETITEQIPDKCLKYDEKLLDINKEPVCIEWSYITNTYDKTSDSWDLLNPAKETLLESFSTQTYDLSWNVILKDGQNDFRYFIDGANGNFSFKVIYLDDYKESILDPFVNSSWGYKAPIVLNGTMINGTHTNFPVLLTEDNMPVGIWALANINGSDIRFSNDSAGSEELAREIVSWNNVTNKTEIWVKVNLTDATNKTIYIWYDYNDATDYAPSDTYGSQNVWNSNYKLVSHNGGGNDSTQYTNDGTGGGGIVAGGVTGKVGTATSFSVASNQYFQIPYDSSLALTSQLTLSAYYSITDTSREQALISRNPNWHDELYTAKSTFQIGTYAIANTGVTNNVMTNVLLTYDETTLIFYFNGLSDGSFAFTDALGTGTQDLFIGRMASGVVAYDIDGIIDEVRILNTTLTPQWINTEYGMMNTPALFGIAGAGTQNEDTTPPTYSCSFNQTYFSQATRLSCVFSDSLLNPKGQYNITLNNTGTFSLVSYGNFTTSPQTITYDFVLNSSVGNYICLNVTNVTDDAGNINSSAQTFCITTIAEPAGLRFFVRGVGANFDKFIKFMDGAIVRFTPRTEPLYVCDATTESDLYYDSSIHNYKFCNSTNWVAMGA